MDPNIYRGGAKIALVNVVAAFGVDNTGATDAGAALTTALAALADTAGSAQQAAFLPAGTYTFDTTTNIAAGAGVRIVGTAGTRLVAALGVHGNPSNAIFAAGATHNALGTTLNGANTLGTTQVNVHSLLAGPNLIAVGSLVFIQSAANPLRAMTYVVTAITGAADPFTLTLDRPVLYQFANADTLIGVSATPQDILIEGNGLTMTGSCDRFMELSGARRCIVKGVVFVATVASDILASFDVSGYENKFVDCFADGGGVGGTSSLLALETQDSSSIVSCYGRNSAGNGFTLYDCVNCTTDGAVAGKCAQDGIVLTADGNTIGSSACRVIGGSANDCVHGVLIDNGSSFCEVIGTNCDFCSTYGLYVTPTGNPTGNQVHAVSARNAGQSGILIAGQGTYLTGIDVTNPNNSGILIDGDVTIDGIRCDGSGTNAVINIGAAVKSNIRGLHAGWTGGSLLVDVVGARTVLRDSYATCGTGTRPGLVVAGVLSASDSFIDGATIGVHVLAGGTARIAGNVSLDTCTTPITVDAGGFCSRRRTVAGAPGGTAVAWPDLKSTDVIQLEPTAAAFTGYVSGRVAGTGFTVTDAGSGTYEYTIV